MKILLSILEVGLPANVDNAHFWSRRGAVKLKVKHRLRTSTLLGSFLTVSDEKSTPFSANFLILPRVGIESTEGTRPKGYRTVQTFSYLYPSRLFTCMLV